MVKKTHYNIDRLLDEGLLRKIPASREKAEESIRTAESWINEAATMLRKALPIGSDFAFLLISQLQYLRRCAVKEIPRGARNKFTERHKERLAREYSEAAKESTEVYKDLRGIFDDGLCGTSDVDMWKEGKRVLKIGLLRRVRRKDEIDYAHHAPWGMVKA